MLCLKAPSPTVHNAEKGEAYIENERKQDMETDKIKITPKAISEEYKRGADFKASLGEHGLFEQTKRNERFFVGDQWHGAKCGNERPLVRRNVIKRLGEYKMSVITAAPITVNYSADGIPNTNDMKEQSADIRAALMEGNIPKSAPDDIEVTAITSALSDYHRTTSERLKFDNKKEQVLRNAFISGTGILFTYWDGDIETGLYADSAKNVPIKGDIACEVLDVENVSFGDPNNDDVQSQPYITIAQRRNIEEVKREARRNGQPTDEIIPDRGEAEKYNSGDRGEEEPTYSRRVTVYTKIYKEWDKNGQGYRVMAVRATEKAYIRKPWNLKIKNYPIAKFCWERRRSSAYGESEITYLIPNQIAINRAITASVWGVMSSGMPIMLVNGDTVTDKITNDPGQIIRIYGSNEDVAGAVKFVQPPNSTTQFQNIVNDLSSSTLSDSGANEAALGNIKPDNASAIIQMRAAAREPLQVYMNRFYDFIEDVARIWADFWFNLYGNRRLRIEDRNGVQYITFDAKRYQKLLITARVDVGAATVYDVAAVVATLDALLERGLINFTQYLERMPAGIIPDVTGLIEDLKAGAIGGIGGEITDQEILESLRANYPEEYARLSQLPPQAQSQMLAELKGGLGGQDGAAPTSDVGMPDTMEVGDI